MVPGSVQAPQSSATTLARGYQISSQGCGLGGLRAGNCYVGFCSSIQFSRAVVSDPATPWTAARQGSLSFTNSQSLLKPMSTESVMPSNHLILCCPILFLPSIFPSIRVFSNQSAFCMRWPKYFLFIEVLKQGVDVGLLALDIKLRQLTSEILFCLSDSMIPLHLFSQ